MSLHYKEGSHLIRRTVKLPPSGSPNYIYSILGDNEFDYIYRWLPNDTWEKIPFAKGMDEAPTNGGIYGRSDEQWVLIEQHEYEFPEAPIDGKQYARMNANWSQIPLPDPFPEAPTDGNIYGRKDLQWTVIEEAEFPEAPEDGKQYARKNSTWTEVEHPDPFPEAPNNGNIYGRKNMQWVLVEEAEFPEAPTDGKFYARRNENWSEVVHPPFPEAPTDGGIYGRRNSQWTIVEDAEFPEAPEDGRYYARRDAGWSEVEHPDPFPEAPTDGKQYARQDETWTEIAQVDPPSTEVYVEFDLGPWDMETAIYIAPLNITLSDTEVQTVKDPILRIVSDSGEAAHISSFWVEWGTKVYINLVALLQTSRDYTDTSISRGVLALRYTPD